MKLPRYLFPIVSLIASAISVQGVTHAVLPGASIQAKINIAVDGDIVAIFGGTYNEDITIDKAIRLVELSGQQVTLAGNVTFSGVSDCPPFDGFTVGSPGRGIAVVNTTDLILRNLTGSTSSGIVASGNSTVEIVNCQTTNISTSGTTSLVLRDTQATSLTAGGSKTEVAKTSFTGSINHTTGTLNVASVTVGGNFDTQSAALKTVAYRTVVTGGCTWRSKKNWIGYSSILYFNYYGSTGKIFFIGNEINSQGQRIAGFYSEGSDNQYFIMNSTIRNSGQVSAIYIRASSSYVLAQNNWLSTLHSVIPQFDRTVRIDSSTNVFIRNNIFDAQNSYWNKCISAPFGVEVSGNIMNSATTTFSFDGGVFPLATNFNADVNFVVDQAPRLQSTSPCINAGTADPRYNNRDGTRNTIGPSGGPWIDPDGWTTENPVVISFDLSPDMVLEGVDTEVILSEGQAVSAP